MLRPLGYNRPVNVNSELVANVFGPVTFSGNLASTNMEGMLENVTRGPWWPWIAHLSHFPHKMNSTFSILIVSNCDPPPPGWGQFWSQGHHMNKMIKVHKEKLHTINWSSIPSSFREEEFWSWFSLFLCSNFETPGVGSVLTPGESYE